jgi:hypothetical protein
LARAIIAKLRVCWSEMSFGTPTGAAILAAVRVQRARQRDRSASQDGRGEYELLHGGHLPVEAGFDRRTRAHM